MGFPLLYLFHWSITILWEQLRLFIILGQAELLSSSLTSGMNISEAIRAHQDYLKLSEGLSGGGGGTLLALLSTPNQELLASGIISGAKSI
jgi:hypothetical protein